MKELKLYQEHTCLKFSKQQQLQLPLLSWGLHTSYIWDLVQTHLDVLSLEKILKGIEKTSHVIEEFKSNQKVIVITNPDLTIEFASHNLKEMSGYLPSEVIGKTPKMFQGEKTDLKITKNIRNKINKKEPFEVSVYNYKKDGSLYYCHIKGYPAFNKNNQLIKYIAIEQEIVA